LTQNGVAEPRHTSTGTTIVGVKFKDGVILGADTRATAGPIVADKNCEKIHYIAPNIWYPHPLPVVTTLSNRVGVQEQEQQPILISPPPSSPPISPFTVSQQAENLASSPQSLNSNNTFFVTRDISVHT
jgi:hypothetical protein